LPIGELRPYTDLDDLVRNGLKTLAPDKPIPFTVAVEKGLKIREALQPALPTQPQALGVLQRYRYYPR
jgi:hypothetical protein